MAINSYKQDNFDEAIKNKYKAYKNPSEVNYYFFF